MSDKNKVIVLLLKNCPWNNSKTKSKSQRNSQEKVADSVSLGAPTKPRLTPTYTSANFNLVVTSLLPSFFWIPSQILFSFRDSKCQYKYMIKICQSLWTSFLSRMPTLNFVVQGNPSSLLKQHFLAVFVSIQILTRGGGEEGDVRVKTFVGCFPSSRNKEMASKKLFQIFAFCEVKNSPFLIYRVIFHFIYLHPTPPQSKFDDTW